MRSFLPPTVCTCIIVDLHGYDGWPALAALEALWFMASEKIVQNHITTSLWRMTLLWGEEIFKILSFIDLEKLLFSVQHIHCRFIAAKRFHSRLFTTLCPPRHVQKATKYFVAVCASTWWGMTSRSVSPTRSTMIAGLVHYKSQIFHNLMACSKHWRKVLLRGPAVATMFVCSSNQDLWSCRVWRLSLSMERQRRMMQ